MRRKVKEKREMGLMDRLGGTGGVTTAPTQRGIFLMGWKVIKDPPE